MTVFAGGDDAGIGARVAGIGAGISDASTDAGAADAHLPAVGAAQARAIDGHPAALLDAFVRAAEALVVLAIDGITTTFRA